MNAHTPWPWKYSGSKNTGCGGLLNGQNGELIAVVYANRVNKNCDSDARLIAAAPDLLEALQLVVDTAENGGWPSAALVVAKGAIAKAAGLDFHPMHSEDIEQCMAAIAKATGGAE